MSFPGNGNIDPRKQECFGVYLYGAGYYSRDDNTLALVTGAAGRSIPEHFCLRCPRQVQCEQEHERLVSEALPEEAELFDRLIKDAIRRDLPASLAAAYASKKGVNPYASVAMDNFARGHADRGKVSGPLTQ